VAWTPADFNEETVSLKEGAWFKNYRIQAIALILIIVVILLIY